MIGYTMLHPFDDKVLKLTALMAGSLRLAARTRPRDAAVWTVDQSSQEGPPADCPRWRWRIAVSFEELCDRRAIVFLLIIGIDIQQQSLRTKMDL